MKLLTDDRLKHRLMGLLVLLALSAIFFPALFKQSNHRIDELMTTTVRLPEKPPTPKVTPVKDKVLFNTVKVQTVVVPKVNSIEPITKVVKAEPIVRVTKKATKVAINQLKSIKPLYGVRLGMFSVQNNAKILVSKLKDKGFKAKYMKVMAKQGTFYQVIVGEVTEKVEALTLQKRIAERTQLKGIVIKTSVS